MILPTIRTLDPLKQVVKVYLTTPIAILRLRKIPWSIQIDLDNPRPKHAVAMSISPGIDTYIADNDVTRITPSVPYVVGYLCDMTNISVSMYEEDVGIQSDAGGLLLRQIGQFMFVGFAGSVKRLLYMNVLVHS